MPQLTARRSLGARLYRGLALVQTRFVRRPTRRPGTFVDYPPVLSEREETVNVWTHAAPAVASVAGGIWLIARCQQQGDALMTLACSVYSLSLFLVLTMSALSHLHTPPRVRQFFRTLDQTAIYFLITGSSTPFMIRYVIPDGYDWLLPVLWGTTLASAWFKLRGHRVNSVSVVPCLFLAWLPTVACQSLLARMPGGCLALVLSMGFLYMLGVVFLCYDHRRPYLHAVWHVLVVAASACTFLAISLYVV